MILWCWLLAALMWIPWAIFAFPTTKWQESDADNMKLVDWSRWYLTLFVLPGLLYFTHVCLCDGLCFNYRNSRDIKKTTKCRDCWSIVFAILQFIVAMWTLAWAIYGAILLADRNDGATTWALVSWIMMDIFLFIYFLVWLSIFGAICYWSYCKKSSSEKSALKRYAQASNKYLQTQMWQPSSNRKNTYSQEQVTTINYDH